ncbi:MAG: DEAD/DEAH box helicase family protein [Planctomycetes bacterium]|nr:DEAD/DEAH box helicase family protein [Planctomycetota bacterium]
MLAALPPELAARSEPLDLQILLGSEESSLRPVHAAREDDDDERSQARIAPALWTIPATGLHLVDAIAWLCSLDPAAASPSLRVLIGAARLARALVNRGDFGPAPQPGVLRWAAHWQTDTQWALAALAEIMPGSLTTARNAVPDDPVYSVTPRNLLVSLIGHAVDQLAATASTQPGRFPKAERLPKEFWQTQMSPVLEILVPERPLEEGVPWALQILVRPIPTIPLTETAESLHQRIASCPFPSELARESLQRVELTIERMAEKLPPLRRAKNMSDGKASLTRQELDQILDHLPMLESEGFELLLPGVESMQRLTARVTLSEVKGQGDTPRPWFEFKWSLAIGDVELSTTEFNQLVDARTPLVFLDRRPVLLSPKDREALQEFKKRLKEGGERISFFEALRLRLGGASHLHGLAMETIASTPRLEALLQNLERARGVENRELPPTFVGELRPYQQRGHAWMYYLVDQGFGACLADDMGLGKTVQAIAVMLDWRRKEGRTGALLIVCPVSVLGNWRREINRFAPELRVVLHHGKTRAETTEDFHKTLANSDIVLTSYNLLQRDEEMMTSVTFEGVLLDEAQNIKNPTTKQSKVARTLKGNFRMTLTGTPLENRPLDLWSIMDFLNEGLLGSRTQFLQTLEHPIVKQRKASSMSALARLVRPFVLRRLKTDPEIVADLPEKTEQIVAATISREQAILYESVVRKGLQEVEKAAEGIQRRGAILTTLLRLKQVCNHPAHYLMDGSALHARSGKLDLLSEMLEEAIEEGDRCLVFTQFKEMGSLLKTHIEDSLKQSVLFLHGGVAQKDRDDMVANFQESRPDGPKVFVLSLKAGGTGLNLTAANRVFHYDRWWNPAVEDQATDRAFRIGQLRNVFVHKFVCTGTLEERIQQMLERKREVADNLLAAGENWITELSNDELKRLLTLDRKEALA